MLAFEMTDDCIRNSMQRLDLESTVIICIIKSQPYKKGSKCNSTACDKIYIYISRQNGMKKTNQRK